MSQNRFPFGFWNWKTPGQIVDREIDRLPQLAYRAGVKQERFGPPHARLSFG
jgi:hypothetical protein